MRRSSFVLTASLFSIAMLACGGGSSDQNVNNGNGNATVKNTNNPLAVVTPTPESTTNNAPTLSPVYKTYCAAWVTKDEAALRKIYSSDTLRDFERQMKEDGIKTLTEFLSDDQVSTELCEARNEQINGDQAIAEVRTKGYPNGIKIVFVKENGEWKMTNRSPALDAVKNSSSSNTNTAKK